MKKLLLTLVISGVLFGLSYTHPTETQNQAGAGHFTSMSKDAIGGV